MGQEMMKIIKQTEIAQNIFELVLEGELVKDMTRPGQFIQISVPRTDLILRRPISLAEIKHDENSCTVIYRASGDGTKSLSKLLAGESIDCLGPLGNGFDLSMIQTDDQVLLVGGGIGVPPLYECGKEIVKRGGKPTFIFGFQTKEVLFYEDKFKDLGAVHIATDDGSYGIEGNVLPLISSYKEETEPKAVYSCGPKGLLATVQSQYCHHNHAYLSLEERMACGTGACYACVCKVNKIDNSRANHKLICLDGPVFKSKEVQL